MSLFKPTFELKPFQVDLVVKALSQPALVIGADPGTGKSIMAITVMCMLLEEGAIDHVLLECEKNKLAEWEADLKTFTRLQVGVLSGGPRQRARVIAQPPQVILGVYESVRSEIARVEKAWVSGRERTRLVPGPLTQALSGRRVLLVWDEASAKLGASRTSAMYKHHEILVKNLRKNGGSLRVLPTTATVVDRDPEGWFNLARLMDPVAAGRVEDFENYHVGRDKYGKAIVFKLLTPEDCPPGLLSLQEKLGHLAEFKSKFAPDIAPLFPEVKVQSQYVDLNDAQQSFYEVVAETDADHQGDYQWNRQLFVVLRQIAGHPLALVRSVEAARAEKREIPQVASLIVSEVGETGLAALGSTKLDVLVDRLTALAGAQALVFTFFGQSLLPLIEERLVKEGFEVVVNHGGLSYPARRRAMADFKDGCQIFLSSDAGARGINLPQAQWVINYEMPLTHSKWWQRINRANRLDSTWPVTYVNDLIVRNTIEDGIVGLGLKRHAWSDELTDDSEDGSNYLSADIRRRLMRISRKQTA